MTGGVVAVLGPIGRNFAAGMSGGVAFLLRSSPPVASTLSTHPRSIITSSNSLNDEFVRNVNMEMVSLVPLDETDAPILLQLLQNHFKYTESAVAKRLLDSWRGGENFVKIYPHDYRRVVEAKKMRKISSLPSPATASSTPPPLPSKESFTSPSHPPQNISTNHSNVMDIEDLQSPDKLNGFQKYPRITDKYRNVAERVQDYDEISQRLPLRELRVQAARCMDCGVPFCQSDSGCPIGRPHPFTFPLFKAT